MAWQSTNAGNTSTYRHSLRSKNQALPRSSTPPRARGWLFLETSTIPQFPRWSYGHQLLFIEDAGAPEVVSLYIVRLRTGRLDRSIWTMKNLPFIDEYVGESVSTWLSSRLNIGIAYLLARTYA